MFVKKMKKILTVLLMLFISSSVFAIEEYVSEIYKQIDTCFTAKDEKQLNKLLSANTTDKYYYLMENYTQKKIRRLIVNNEYDFAMEATLVVIENNPLTSHIRLLKNCFCTLRQTVYDIGSGHTDMTEFFFCQITCVTVTVYTA